MTRPAAVPERNQEIARELHEVLAAGRPVQGVKWQVGPLLVLQYADGSRDLVQVFDGYRYVKVNDVYLEIDRAAMVRCLENLFGTAAVSHGFRPGTAP